MVDTSEQMSIYCLGKANEQVYRCRVRVSGLVVSVQAFNSDVQSLDPADVN